MTDHDRDELAEAIAARVHAAGCPLGWKREDADTLRQFADSLREFKRAVIATVVGAVCLGLIGLLCAGVYSRVRSAVAPPGAGQSTHGQDQITQQP
jgi:TRAP-type C4-dicarboxylate transport system permease small subunit